MSRRSRSLSVAVALAAAGVLAAFPSPAPAGSCQKHKETKGCTLPNGTSYQYTRTDTDEMNLSIYRGKAQLDLRSACVEFRSKRFAFKVRPKVGKTYEFSDTENVTSELLDGITVTYTYKIDLKVKIASARKATTTGTATVTAPAVPPQGSFAGEDAFNSNCELKRTLKRVVDD